MKVRITATVEIDPEMWALNFGFHPADKTKIRQDVRDYCVGMIVDQLVSIGVAEEGTV